ncbi:MAG TPA: AMP-binding protein, partial [Acidimicrobiia bacterium]|nr:AMP-binding protein [Acidimicrobiia bacterium]
APLRVQDGRSGSDRYVMYTGGTTGMPKGVLWQQSDLIKGVLLAGGRHGPPRTVGEAVDRARASGARVLAAAPLMHGLGQWMALGSLLSGNTVVLDESRHFDPRRLWSLAAAAGAAVIGVAGDAMAGPLADVLPDVAGSLDLSALKVLYSSAALLSPAVRGKLLSGLPHIRVVDAYGSSETGPHAQATAATATGPGEGGRFVVDHRTAVLDDALCPVEPGSGAVGWAARTGHIALGYHKDPERTARTFPVIGGVRWSVSGDAATVEADGSIRLLGRGAACINSGGEKIYPDEVEAALKAHPVIRDAVVVGVPDARFGERVVAVVSSRDGAIPEADLDRHVRRSLAGYKVPRAYFFVPDVRRSPAGKPDYRWAREEVLQRAGAPAG